jgi:hypothetical protein
LPGAAEYANQYALSTLNNQVPDFAPGGLIFTGGGSSASSSGWPASAEAPASSGWPASAEAPPAEGKAQAADKLPSKAPPAEGKAQAAGKLPSKPPPPGAATKAAKAEAAKKAAHPEWKAAPKRAAPEAPPAPKAPAVKKATPPPGPQPTQAPPPAPKAPAVKKAPPQAPKAPPGVCDRTREEAMEFVAEVNNKLAWFAYLQRIIWTEARRQRDARAAAKAAWTAEMEPMWLHVFERPVSQAELDEFYASLSDDLTEFDEDPRE